MSYPKPSIIVGPAIVTWGSFSYYAKSGIQQQFTRDTFNIETDFDGTIDVRHKSQKTEVSFTPVGVLSAGGFSAAFPYGVSNVGSSVFTSTNKPLVIVTKFGGASNTGQTITFPRAALTKAPQLRLKSQETLFGDLTFTALGDPTVVPTGTTAWQALVDAAFADTSFDESQLVTDVYQAAWGSSPYNAMGSMNGFEVEINYGLNPITADDWGLVDMILNEITATARFEPSNITEANLIALLNNQGTNFVYPGQSLSKAGTDLVITGSGNGGTGKTLTFTLKNAGPRAAQFRYDTKNHRHGAVEFTSKRTWTTGAANNLFTFSVA